MACGSTTPSNPATPDAAAEASLDSGPADAGADAFDARTPDSAADASMNAAADAQADAPTDSGDGGASEAGKPFGTVAFTNCQGDATACGTAGAYSFAAFFLPSSTPGCPFTTYGACQYSPCGYLGATGVSTGTITLSGGTLAAPVQVPVGTGGAYAYAPTSALFMAGQTLTASASGDVVPAWGPVSVVAPSAATLVSPASGATIPSTQDLTVTWSGGQSGARVRVTGAPSVGFGAYFECDWDASLGQGVIPQALLTALAGQSPNVSVGQSQLAITTVDAGGYAVSVEAVQSTGFAWTLQ
jgi:hypothetical protein